MIIYNLGKNDVKQNKNAVTELRIKNSQKIKVKTG